MFRFLFLFSLVPFFTPAQVLLQHSFEYNAALSNNGHLDRSVTISTDDRGSLVYSHLDLWKPRGSQFKFSLDVLSHQSYSVAPTRHEAKANAAYIFRITRRMSIGTHVSYKGILSENYQSDYYAGLSFFTRSILLGYQAHYLEKSYHSVQIHYSLLSPFRRNKKSTDNRTDVTFTANWFITPPEESFLKSYALLGLNIDDFSILGGTTFDHASFFSPIIGISLGDFNHKLRIMVLPTASNMGVQIGYIHRHRIYRPFRFTGTPNF